nr:MAG TPA: hypothetical protein [Bacteriophage sp.]
MILKKNIFLGFIWSIFNHDYCIVIVLAGNMCKITKIQTLKH